MVARYGHVLIGLITGVKTNIPFLFRVLSHDVFVTGKTWTTVGFLSYYTFLSASYPSFSHSSSSTTLLLFSTS